jgi:hypothetical protein
MLGARFLLIACMPVPTYNGGYRFDQGWFYDREDQPLPLTPALKRLMAKIKLEMYHFNVPESVGYFRVITGKMTGNTTFTSLAAKTTAQATDTDELETAWLDYQGALHVAEQKLAIVYGKLADAQETMRVLAAGAEAVTQDPAALLSGGFDLQAERTPVGPMPKVEEVKATGGDLDGSADLQWKPVKRGLQTYLARYGASSNGPWTQFYAGTKSRTTATGLTSGNEYFFEVCAVGAAGPGPWSDVARIRAT